MSIHVDVVKNDWLAGIQHPVATITLADGGRLVVQAENRDHWLKLLVDLAGDHDPATPEFLSALHERLRGSTIFATEAHEEEACEYRQHPVHYLRGESASGAVPLAR